MIRSFPIGVLVIIAVTFASCGSSRKLVPPAVAPKPAPFKTDSVLSAKLGKPVPAGTNSALVEAMAEWIGVPYKFGGMSKEGTDCSGLIANIYPRVYGLAVPRTTTELYKKAMKVDRDTLKEGDLLFFTIDTREPGHSGLFLWNGYFLHASSSRGVMISSLNEPYWNRYFTSAGRMVASKP